MNSEMCPTCHGTGMSGATYEDVWNPCGDCEGAGEIFDGESDE